jgi:RNA polymerase sigma-70 factor (ECF subfamily)
MPDRPADDRRSHVGRLYDSFGTSLYRYALMLLADAAAAEDAIQQVFASLLRQNGRIDSDIHYLRRAVRNECFSMLRRRRNQSRSEMAIELPLLDAIEPIAAGAVDHDERLALERAIRELPPEQREVIHLHVFEGLTFKEIAAASNASLNTVAARYRYALAKLRRILADAGGCGHE